MATKQEKVQALFFLGLFFFFFGWVVFPDMQREINGFQFNPFIVVGFIIYIMAFVFTFRKEFRDIFGF